LPNPVLTEQEAELICAKRNSQPKKGGNAKNEPLPARM
jgi:hypothetical protein